MLSSGDILTELGTFISDMFRDFTTGQLFFGGPLDIVISVLDILATTLVTYYILKVLRDTRAWQLLKGVFLIIAFAIICSLIGLTTVGFIFNNTISVLAIAFVVIFQPELRRALEAVGRNSFSVISSAITQDDNSRSSGSVHKLIEAIVRACEKLAETRTGALIIIERQTRLGELVEQENVVQLDAAVSATMLMQVFYKGSPLHDGAVLIRESRLTAARVHVPLSDNYHLRKDYGTRHRAAIGASEMGDAIAVVVSEERGSISLALEGRLYTLDNADALRTLLHKLLGVERAGEGKATLGSRLRSGIRQTRSKKDIIAAAAAPNKAGQITGNVTTAGVKKSAGRVPRRNRVLLLAASFAIALILWLYVQVTINPVVKQTFDVALTTKNMDIVKENGFALQTPSQTIHITIQGREKAVTDLSTDEITAYIDLAAVESTGLNSLEVKVDTQGMAYLEAISISPSFVSVNIESTK